MEPMCLASVTSFSNIAKEAEAKEPSPYCSLAEMGQLPMGGGWRLGIYTTCNGRVGLLSPNPCS